MKLNIETKLHTMKQYAHLVNSLLPKFTVHILYYLILLVFRGTNISLRRCIGYTGCIKKTQPWNFLRNHFEILKHKRF
jgi:hypothetical protein